MERKRTIRRLRNIIDKQLSAHPTLQHVNLKFHNKNINPRCYTDMYKRKRITIDLSLPSSFTNSTHTTISEYDFVETVVSFYHESYHALQLTQNNREADMNNELTSFISRYYNDETYANEYHKFSFEIAAERYALCKTYKTLTTEYPTLNTEAILIDYVNARTHSEQPYKYFITSTHPFTTMNDIFNAFDTAYTQSYINKKDFSSSKTDCVSTELQANTHLRIGFNKAHNGKEQTRFAASIVLDKHPELYKIYPTLNKNKYDLQRIIDMSLDGIETLNPTDEPIPHL